jgi:hypothetical protein
MLRPHPCVQAAATSRPISSAASLPGPLSGLRLPPRVSAGALGRAESPCGMDTGACGRILPSEFANNSFS